MLIMNEEPKKELVDDGVFPGMIEEEKVADQGVALPEEKTQEVMAKDAQEEEAKTEVENREGGEQDEEVVSGTLLKNGLKDDKEEDKAEEAKEEEMITAGVPEDSGDDSDDQTEKALSDDGSAHNLYRSTHNQTRPKRTSHRRRRRTRTVRSQHPSQRTSKNRRNLRHQRHLTMLACQTPV
jgi:hypothetical protein